MLRNQEKNKDDWHSRIHTETYVEMGPALSARFNGNAMGMAREAHFILGRGFLSWGPLGSLSSFPLHNRRAGSGQGSPTQTLTERARRPSRAPSPLDLAVCDSVRESGNVPFWYLLFSGAQFKVLFVGIFSPAPSSILPSDFSSTVFFRLVEIYSDSHCTVDLHYFAAFELPRSWKLSDEKKKSQISCQGACRLHFSRARCWYWEWDWEYLNVVNGIYCFYYHGSNCKTEITDFISCPGPIDAYSN